MTRSVEVRFLPSGRSMRLQAGSSLFTAAHWLGVPIDSLCGGLGTCGRCRVKIQSGRAETTAADREHLSETELADGWRLACTAQLHEDTSCLTPVLAELPAPAMTGAGRAVVVEPAVHKICLDLEPPSETDLRSDLERLRDALLAEGLPLQVELRAMRELSATLRRSGFQITAAVAGSYLVTVEPGDTHTTRFGVAFDLGTTTVVGSLVDLESGEVLDVEATLNDQTVFGGDVISRIGHAMQGETERGALRRAAVDTLNRLVDRLCQASAVDRRSIYEAVVVGNATMLHLLLGCDARPLAVAPFVPAFRDPRNDVAAEVGLDIHPQGRVETFPLIGAYVGADTVAGLHAVDMARQDELWLFIDVGTNSEIALGSGARLLATAAPAGPAFEGSCIRAGMAATRGAVEHVGFDGAPRLAVIGGGAPQGICGSGLIDLLAELLRTGLLDRSGRFIAGVQRADHPLGHLIVERDGERCVQLSDNLVVTQRDIRELQMAKSSVATGVRVLMERLGIGPSELDAVLLAGSFGSAIDPASARGIGLVPSVPLDKIRFVGNVAAEGAKMGLLSFRERQVAYELARRVEYVELSGRIDFNDLFVEELAFPGVGEQA